MGETRKIAAILAADVVGYSRLTGADEASILARLRTLRSDLIDPIISVHNGRVVKRIAFRIGIHIGDVVEESDGDLMGDSVNVAARLEGQCEPGGICISEDTY